MMNTFRYLADSNHFNCLEARSRDWPILDQFHGVPLKQDWKPLKLRWDKTVSRRGDFPSLRNSIPVFSQHAWDTLSHLLSPFVEALPVICGKEEWYLINVINVIDYLDHERSEIIRFESLNRIMYINKFVFNDNVPDSSMIWKIPESADTDVFVSEVLKNAIEESKLRGVLFQKTG